MEQKRHQHSPTVLEQDQGLVNHQMIAGEGKATVSDLSPIPGLMVDRASSAASIGSSPTRNAQNVTPFKRHCLKPTYVEMRIS